MAGRRWRKILIGAALLALTVGVGGGGAAVWLFKRAEPVYQGRQKLAGLAAPVDVFRDTYGIPHIFASTAVDAARALGYVHAGERLLQMEMQRRAGQGRLAEMFGADLVGVDRLTRTLGLYRLAQSSFEALSPDARAVFQAYADGVNDWLRTQGDRLPPEFLLLQVKPEPWQAADSVVWGKLMALQLSHNYAVELLRAELVGKLAPEKISWLFPPIPAGTPVTVRPQARALPQPASQGRSLTHGEAEPESPALGHSVQEAALASEGDRLGALVGLDHAASNEWVVGGARTISGKPLLANDPHLGLEAPILWYLARIVTPQGSVKGATVPGLPLVLLGQNDHVAWGFTSSGIDVEDLFVETVDPADTRRYLTPKGSEAFVARDEVIKVKNAPDVPVHLRATRHGPVMSDVNAEMARLAGKGKVMALAFTGLGDKDTTSEALLRMNHAGSAVEFLAALRLYQSPSQNVVYADDKGSFGYISPGLVPVRKSGSGLAPVDGASGAFDWVGVIPPERLPQVVNPAAGFIFNANNVTAGSDPRDNFGQDWEEPYRARRLQQFFDANQPFSREQMAAMQGDHISLAARDFLPLLLTVLPSSERGKRAMDLLQTWDGRMDKDRPEPAIFEAWLWYFHAHMLTEKTGVELREKGPFAAMTLQALVTQHGKEWCGDVECRALMGRSFDEAVELLRKRQGSNVKSWRWGRENVAVLRHKFYSHIPVLSMLSDLSVASSGDFYTLDRGGGFSSDPERPFARTHGGGFRGIYDLADTDASLFMIATGESGHILSPHYGDLTPWWNDVGAVTLSGSAEYFMRRKADHLELMP